MLLSHSAHNPAGLVGHLIGSWSFTHYVHYQYIRILPSTTHLQHAELVAHLIGSYRVSLTTLPLNW